MTSKAPPHLLEHIEAIEPLVSADRFGLVVDFDGTISEFVDQPDRAKIFPGCVRPLRGLSARLALVAVMSGRGVEDIRRKTGIESLTYVGNHGAEYLRGGVTEVAAPAGGHSETIKQIFEELRLRADGPGLVWEYKGFSATTHFRMAENEVVAKSRLQKALESTPGVDGLEVFWGNKILEIRARTGINKGYALRKLADEAGLDAVIFLGDDTTDLDAVRALSDMRREKAVDGMSVVVVQPGSPAGMLEESDYSLADVSEVAVFLDILDREAASSGKAGR
ncbi:MAG: trehalose-phosphatase [Chloroflexi bacterium]|nr:trehalose-phosphatase [Chloroflexota bacterium]